MGCGERNLLYPVVPKKAYDIPDMSLSVPGSSCRVRVVD